MFRLPPLPVAPALLVVPPIGVATPEAYQLVDAARHGVGLRGAVALDLDALSGWGSIGRLAGNDFESALFGRHPELKRAFEALAATHPLLCRMSGSGSTLFARVSHRSGPGRRENGAGTETRRTALSGNARDPSRRTHARPEQIGWATPLTAPTTPPYFSAYWPLVQWQDSRLWICEWWFESTGANRIAKPIAD